MTTTKKPAKGARAPASVSFYDRSKQFLRNLPHGLTQAARATAHILFLHGHDDGGSIYVSVETVMDMTGLQRRTQFRAFKELLEAGYLVEDGWHTYANGVKTRRRRLVLSRMAGARAAEIAAAHGDTGDTVVRDHSDAGDTLHSDAHDTVHSDTGDTQTFPAEPPLKEQAADARERAGEALSAEEASAAFDALFGTSPPPAPEPPSSRRRPHMPSLGDLEHRWAGLADSTEIDPKSMSGESIHYRRGWAIRQIAHMVANEVGWYAATIRPDWTPLLRWLDDGLCPHDSIIPAIRRVMARQGGRTEVMSLSYFDRAVREEGTRRRRLG